MTTLEIPVSSSQTDEKKTFTMGVGDLKPGDLATVTYRIKVDRNIAFLMTQEHNNTLNIKNTAGVHRKTVIVNGNNHWDKSYDVIQSTDTTLYSADWTKKVMSTKTQSSQPIQMTGENVFVYETDGTESSERSFTVPDRSLSYSVKVNESGVGNVTNSVFRDSLTSDHKPQTAFAYTGFVKVEVYKGPQQTISNSVTAQKDPDVILFVRLPNSTDQFSFRPADYPRIQELEQSLEQDVNLSYRLTYFVAPVSENSPDMVLGNSFTGVIGYGSGGSYQNLEVNSEVSYWTAENNMVRGRKTGLMMIEKENEEEAYANGRLIWLARVEATSIPKGMTIHDSIISRPEDNSGRWHHLLNDSVIGVFKSNQIFSQAPFSGYDHLKGDAYDLKYEYDDVLNALKAGRLSQDLYSVELEDPTHLKVTFQESIPLNKGEYIYFLIQTTPDETAEHFVQNKGNFSYTNNLSYSFGNTDPEDLDHDTLTWRHYYSIRKEFWCDFTARRNDENKTALYAVLKNQGMGATEEKMAEVVNSVIRQAGIEAREHTLYTDWCVTANLSQDETGDATHFKGPFEVVEHIPENAKFVTVWMAEGSGPNLTGSRFDENILSVEESEDHRTVRILLKERPEQSKFVLHIVTEQNADWDEIVSKSTTNQKVTTSNTLDFYNRGNHIGTASASRNHEIPGVLSKKGPGQDQMGPAAGDGIMDFEIRINQSGHDLIENSDVIDLEDQFDDRIFQIDPSSITITDGNGQSITASVSVSDRNAQGKTTLRIYGLPDRTPVTIRYKARIVTQPGSNPTVNNSVTWRGYGKKAPTYTYSHSYSVNSEAHSTSDNYEDLELLKVDQDDLLKGINGVEFSLYRCSLPYSQTEEPDKIGDFVTETIDEKKGCLRITKAMEILEHDTLYMLMEKTAAPSYLPDETRHFIYFKSSNKEVTLPEGTLVKLSHDKAELTVTNTKPKISIQLKKTFGSSEAVPGTYLFGLYSEVPTENSSPVQMRAITAAEGNSQKELSVQFDPVPLDVDEYYVYELDPDTRKPIAYGTTFTNDGSVFKVLEGGQGTVITNADHHDGDSVTVSINNQPALSLPQTGGTGLGGIELAGLLLMSTGSLYLVLKKRKKN